MILNLGVGGGRFNTIPLNADIFMDIDLPNKKLSNFILGDAHHLPFIQSVFDLAYCHNVLEHVKSPIVVIQELKRVSSHIHIVQDRVWAIASYSTSSHIWFQGPNHKFYKYPRTRLGIILSNWLHHLLYKYLTIWQRLHFTIWRRWTDYYLVIPHYEVSI